MKIDNHNNEIYSASAGQPRRFSGGVTISRPPVNHGNCITINVSEAEKKRVEQIIKKTGGKLTPNMPSGK